MTITRALVAVSAATLLAGCQQTTATPTSPPVSIAASATAAPMSCHALLGRADTHCTPGVTNPQVTQLNIATTICRKGWTATIRPPVSYTDNLKRAGIAAYGYPDRNLSDYEEDHLIALELGGSPTDPGNLWPEPHANPGGSSVKDAEENTLNRAVCQGRMRLLDAQAKLRADWTHG